MTQIYNDHEIAALVPAVVELKQGVSLLKGICNKLMERVCHLEDGQPMQPCLERHKPKKPKRAKLTIDHPRAIRAMRMYRSKKYRVGHILKSCKMSSCTLYSFLKRTGDEPTLTQ